MQENLVLHGRHVVGIPLWVHWLVAPILVQKWRNIACFSSIPTEYRHRAFKFDIQHSFLGNKLTRPLFARRGFAHVLHLHMLDLALLPPTLKNRNKASSLLKNGNVGFCVALHPFFWSFLSLLKSTLKGGFQSHYVHILV